MLGRTKHAYVGWVDRFGIPGREGTKKSAAEGRSTRYQHAAHASNRVMIDGGVGDRGSLADACLGPYDRPRDGSPSTSRSTPPGARLTLARDSIMSAAPGVVILFVSSSSLNDASQSY